MLNALLGFHMPRWQAEGLVEDYAHYRRGEAATISADVKKVTGNLPGNFRSFAHAFKSAFSREWTFRVDCNDQKLR